MNKPLPVVSMIMGIVTHDIDLEIIWSSVDGKTYSVRFSLIEAFTILDYLQRAFQRGQDSERLYALFDIPTLETSGINQLQGVESVKGVVDKGSQFGIQWTDEDQDWQELLAPTGEAYRLMRLLENNLPTDRGSTHDIQVKFARPIPINGMTRIWRPAYRANRYLKKLTEDELRSRTHFIFANAMRLEDDRKFRPVFLKDEKGNYVADRGIDWLRLLTDVHTELELRGRDVDLKPRVGEKTHIAQRLADEAWCWRPDLVDGSAPVSTKLERPRMIFKYGKAKWNRQIIEDGIIRISPASTYDDSSLNAAIEDDELNIQFYDKTGKMKNLSVDNYYVYCVSGIYDYRLFPDFGADSCLAIKDVDEFTKRLWDATKGHIQDKVLYMTTAPVVYMDPFNIGEPETDEEVYFGKNFRYAYQREFRFVWPPRDAKSIKPIDLEIGDITDIAELVIEGSPAGAD